MKKLILLFMLCIWSYVSSSQDLTITFNAKSDTVAIDSIHVLSLRTNQAVKLSRGQNLILVKTSTNLDVLPLVDGNLMVYPNPAREHANLSFNVPASQNVVINMHNISGQLLLREAHSLHSGKHQFQVKFPVSGLYHISVGTDNSLLSSKVLYFGDKTDIAEMKYSGSDLYDIPRNQLKSANSGTGNNTLEFKPGDVIHYTIYSGGNMTLISDTPTESTTVEVEFFKCIDPGGKSYKTVKIGVQVWMAENLAHLPSVSPSSQGSTKEPHYYVYDYQGTDVTAAKQHANYKTYGVLFNWPAAMAGAASSSANPSKVQGVCPAGWHLPSDAEWKQLEMELGMTQSQADEEGWRGTNQGTQLKAISGWVSNGNGTNTSGFSALPGGARVNGGAFNLVGDRGSWWSSTELGSSSARYRLLFYNGAYVFSYYYDMALGFSVRCVRD